jgi:hypothetical protein
MRAWRTMELVLAGAIGLAIGAAYAALIWWLFQ